MFCSASTSSAGLMPHPVNLNGDLEITMAPEKNILSMAFCPDKIQKTTLAASSEDDTVRLWQFDQGKFFPTKVLEMGQVLDICWSVDGRKIYMASRDHKLKCWDLESEVSLEHEAHHGPVTTCNLIKGSPYESCIMTGSWDNTIKVWDVRQQKPVDTACVDNRVVCVDVDFPNVVVCTPYGSIYNYDLRNGLQLVRQIVPPYESETRCVAIFRDKNTNVPKGYIVGIPEGRLFTIYDKKPQKIDGLSWLNTDCPNNVTVTPRGKQSNAANDIKRHPIHETLAVVRSDGTYSVWDPEPYITRLKKSKNLNRPITKCCFDTCGFLFAYSTACVWSKNVFMKPRIYCNITCFDDMAPTPTNCSGSS